MTATNNPQTAADQARATYRQMTDQLSHLGLDAAVRRACAPLPRRAWRRPGEAYDHSLDAFDTSLTTFERTFDAAGQGATAFNRKIIDIARRNVDAGFDLATSLAGAKSLTDISGTSGGLLAQAVRRIDGASRGSSRAVDEGHHRCSGAD